MATQITWVIEWMKSKPVEGQYQDVVITAGWRCNGVDGSYTGTAYGTSSFPGPSNPFTPYDQLTQQQVLDWCWGNGVDKIAVEGIVQGQIQNKISPPEEELPLPWA